jgi:hypothetical protein
MSIDIYAAKTLDTEGDLQVSPIFSFDRWAKNRLAHDADARSGQGQSAFIPNPDYVEDAGLTLPDEVARHLFHALGYELQDANLFDITEVTQAALRARNSTRKLVPATTETCAKGAAIHGGGLSADDLDDLIEQLQRILAKGRAAGSTCLAVA